MFSIVGYDEEGIIRDDPSLASVVVPGAVPAPILISCIVPPIVQVS